MADAAREAHERPLLKVKLGGAGDPERFAAMWRAAPGATLIVDANEAWTPATLDENLAACVALIEQPLPAHQDDALRDFDSPIPLCADEGFHDRSNFDALAGRYRAVNLKLDKTGVHRSARGGDRSPRGLWIMAACMAGTSLVMAPAFMLTPFAQYVDLDGPLLLAQDRVPGIRFDGSTMLPFGAEV